jgi:hypothetical protein
MATQDTPLWIDPFENRLYSDPQTPQSPPTLTFKQGDAVNIELYLVKRALAGGLETLEFPPNCTVRVAVGKMDAPATTGTFTITYGGNTTTALAYNASASVIQTALNALASITSAGGVTVSIVSNTMFRVAFNSVGVRSGFTTDTGGLVPTSSTKVVTMRAGTAELTAICLFKTKQSAIAFQNSWVDSPAPSITITELVENRSKRVSISPTPVSGSWTLTTTHDIVPKVEADGNLDDLETYWGQVIPHRWSAFTTDFKGPGTGEDVYHMDVVQTGLTSWDFTVKPNYEIPEDYTMPMTASGNFTKFPSKNGSLNFNTVEVEYALGGQASVTANLEVEIEYENGDRWTALQTNCVIVNDLIDQVDFDPLTLDACVTEAPVDGNSYLRKDGSWVTDVDGGTY